MDKTAFFKLQRLLSEDEFNNFVTELMKRDKNAIKDILVDKIRSPLLLLLTTFQFDNSDLGFCYWHNIVKRIENIK